MAEATTDPIRLPAGPRLPALIQGIAFLSARQRVLPAQARADHPGLGERSDVLALLLGARYDDGAPIADDHVADELLTLLAAGHETTATTLSWTVERLRRHPALLDRLEHDDGALRQAVIWEVQRTRPVVEITARIADTRIRLGDWVLPKGTAIIPSFGLSHRSAANFDNPAVFDPDRFLGSNPYNYAWIPYGGGVRRCIGAAFANMEMMVTLRILLQDFTFGTTTAAGEHQRSRGVAVAPGNGGRAVVFRRRPHTATTQEEHREQVHA